MYFVVCFFLCLTFVLLLLFLMIIAIKTVILNECEEFVCVCWFEKEILLCSNEDRYQIYGLQQDCYFPRF
jgi:hypothetical protein